MIALSIAPMPMKGMEEARAMEKFEASGAEGCGVLFASASTLSALTAASNSDLYLQMRVR
jgi:hypothetical protein